MNNLFRKINATAEWKIITLIIVATSLLYLAMIHIEPAPNTMEARNLVAARECVLDNHWLVTTMNGVPRLRKPPLPTWIAALTMKAAGSTNSLTVGRLPNLAVMSLMAIFIYIFARRWLMRSFALTAAMAAVTSTIMWNSGKRATWDIFTICFAFAGVWLLQKALSRNLMREGQEERTQGLRGISIAIFFAAVMWGLSFLSKGPVTLYSILLPFLLALITSSLITKTTKERRWWPLLIIVPIALLIGSSWWLAMSFLEPDTMMLLKSETKAWHTLHKKGPFFYLSFPLEVLPWTLPLIGSWILLALRKTRGQWLVTGRQREGLILALLWFVFTIILLSLIPEKKMRYAAVTVMPSSLLAAFFLSVIYESGKSTLTPLLALFRSLLSVQLALVATPETQGSPTGAHLLHSGQSCVLLYKVTKLLEDGTPFGGGSRVPGPAGNTFQ